MSTSPPPGEPGQDTLQNPSGQDPSGDPELLYSLFPSAEPVRAEAPAPTERPRRRRVPAVPLLAALIAVVLMSGVMVAVDHGTEAEAVTAPAVVRAGTEPEVFGELPIPPTTTTRTALPLAAPAPRTKPSPPPANERAKVPIVKIGEIRIPKIGLVHPIFEGITLTVVDKGPGHWPGSAVPGQLGNSVFAGHRVTHSRPFRNVDKLVAGDEVIFAMPDGTFTYKMTKQQIVSPTDTWIVNPTESATLTLFACHPPGSAAKRIVIRADYVGRT